MIKVAIVGCGKIAESHGAQILRIPNCQIVAVSDRELLMAQQFAQRFAVPGIFTDVAALLREARPDVVHITTPPQSHFPLAKQCLEHGTNVYVEKPFTLNAAEAEELVALAEKKGLKITAGHDDQFRHTAREMRRLIKEGYLGSAPVHMESYYCYELAGGYAKALLADRNHWVRLLPGQLLHNIISHGIARVAEHLTTDSPQVIAHGFVSPFLREMGETEIVDELRVIISEAGRTTAYFTFSSQMRPTLHQFRVFGSRNGLVLDQDNETLIRLRGARYKSYLDQFAPPLVFAKQYARNGYQNVRKFLANDFHMKSGMKFLIESFYLSIRELGPLPIPYTEIVRTARLMDAIFAQLPRAGSPAPRNSEKPR